MESDRGASRRDVLNAATWSVPVVVAAAAAPMAAASGVVTFVEGYYEWDAGVATGYVYFSTGSSAITPTESSTTVAANAVSATIVSVGFDEIWWQATFTFPLAAAGAPIPATVAVAGIGSDHGTLTYL